jgi:dipeptidyl aminopeptidase/acylaminoacyl peptidase
LEEQGRSWLVSRASSTDVKALDLVDAEDEVADLAVFEGDHQGVLDDQEDVDESVTTWLSWFRAMIEIAQDEDEEEEERVWTPPKRRAVSFATDGVVGGKSVDEGIVERARERDEEHGLDGWMDGAAYLAFLGARALGGFF